MSILVVPDGEPCFSEMGTSVQIEDESGGEFVVVSQLRGKISINPEEWPLIRDAIDQMIYLCEDEK